METVIFTAGKKIMYCWLTSYLSRLDVKDQKTVTDCKIGPELL